MVPSEDIMQTLLVHEPKAGSSRLPDHESSDESERDGFGAGTAPAGGREQDNGSVSFSQLFVFLLVKAFLIE